MHSYTKITLTTYIKQLRKYWKTSSLAGISVVAGSAANLVAPLYYKKFFDIITIADTGNDKADALIAIITTILILHGISWVFWRISVLCIVFRDKRYARFGIFVFFLYS